MSTSEQQSWLGEVKNSFDKVKKTAARKVGAVATGAAFLLSANLGLSGCKADTANAQNVPSTVPSISAEQTPGSNNTGDAHTPGADTTSSPGATTTAETELTENEKETTVASWIQNATPYSEVWKKLQEWNEISLLFLYENGLHEALSSPNFDKLTASKKIKLTDAFIGSSTTSTVAEDLLSNTTDKVVPPADFTNLSIEISGPEAVTKAAEDTPEGREALAKLEAIRRGVEYAVGVSDMQGDPTIKNNILSTGVYGTALTNGCIADGGYSTQETSKLNTDKLPSSRIVKHDDSSIIYGAGTGDPWIVRPNHPADGGIMATAKKVESKWYVVFDDLNAVGIPESNE